MFLINFNLSISLRDISLNNDSQGNSKICDFGECLKMSDKTTSYESFTIFYNSPESLCDEVLYYAQDFWSFGIFFTFVFFTC
jgi:serine/threonine protein kinase